MNISTFLNEDYSDSALYIAYRSIASYLDGLKNSQRKVVYTIKKTNLKAKTKVSALGSKVVDNSGYLHGDTSIQDTIVTMTRDYCGANNLPVIEPNGSFGTRLIPEAAAPRYIFSQPTKYFDYLFRKEDDKNLIKQEFEGSEIEPMFYIPTLPIILVNGSTGVGVGFASTVLARDLNNIIKLVENYLNGKPNDSKLLIPNWHGFTGKVEKVENKWLISGNISSISGRKVIIDELPISYSLPKYIKILKSLKEKGVIEKYIDYSENDKFKFEVTLKFVTDNIEKIMKDLKLTETITENLVCVDEHNSLKEFNSVEELFESFCKIKIQFLEKRIKSEIERLAQETNYLQECYNFIMDVINNKINVKVKKTEVEKQLKDLKYNYIDKLLGMPIYSLTIDKAEDLKEKLENKRKELSSMKEETPITIWKKDLEELKKCINMK